MNRGAVSRRVNKSSAKAQWIHKLYEEVLEFLGCAQLHAGQPHKPVIFHCCCCTHYEQSQLLIVNSRSFEIVKSVRFVITCAAFETESLFRLMYSNILCNPF